MAYSPCYLLFGIGGILGNSMYLKLSEKAASFRVFAFDRPRADISNRTHIAPLIGYIKPTVVFNCAAVNNLELCEDSHNVAYSANSIGPRIIASECAKRGIKFVHFSSPYVFDGKRHSPYSEKCLPNPINVQGKSKLEGEKGIAEETDNFLIIRPGWVFGEDGENCVTEWITRAERGMNIGVPADEHGSPTYVGDLVTATLDLVARNETGIFHLANSDAATSESFAQEMLQMAKLDHKLVRTVSKKSQARRWFKAPLPQKLLMSSAKYGQKTGATMRPWREALSECLFNMHKYRPGNQEGDTDRRLE